MRKKNNITFGKEVSLVFFLSLAVLAATLTLTVTKGYGKDRQGFGAEGSKQQVIHIDGFFIPVFATAGQQLHYSQSSFENLAMQRAAIKAVCRLFPKQEKYCGVAALELAYLLLGNDYRLAGDEQFQQAIDRYRQILKTYHAQPEVAAKALWYLGWITCDLQGKPEKGIQYYQEVVAKYGRITMGFDLPLHEVRSLYLGKKPSPSPTFNKSSTYWATVALVEIAKNSQKPQEINSALVELTTNYHNSIATGLAIKSVLQQGKLPKQSEPIVRQYLASRIGSPPLKRDIRRLQALDQRRTIK